MVLGKVIGGKLLDSGAGHDYSVRKVLAHVRNSTSKNALSEAAPDANAQTIAA